MRNNNRRPVKPLAFLALLVLAGCPSPLLNQIEETVEVVVTPPTISAIYPINESTDIPVNTELITISFTKAIQESLSSGAIQVVDSTGNAIAGTIVVSNDTVTFRPNDILDYETTYTITATVDVLDIDGNPLPEPFSWTFTTGLAPDTEPPHSLLLTINNDAAWATANAVTLTITAADNRGIAQMNISNTNAFSDSGWTTFTSPVQWSMADEQGNKTVYVKLRDGAGNTSANAASDSIQLDSIVPSIDSFKINYGKAATNNNTVLLNIETSDSGSGPYQFRYRIKNGSWMPWQSLDALGIGEVTGVSLGAPENAIETFEAEMSDTAGNLSALSEASILYELTPPSVSSTFPEDNTNTYPSNAGNIYVSFSEALDPNTITQNTFYLMDGATQILGTEVSFILVDENEVYPENTALLRGLELDQNAAYTVVVEGTVQDIAGNSLGSDYTWFFRTSDAVDSAPPEGTIELDYAGQASHFTATATATNSATLVLTISATDTYNDTYGYKIWGDNDGSVDADTGQPFPSFEENAVWELYKTSKNWQLSAGDGSKYIFYKFMDAAANQTATPQRLKISLDTTDPVITSMTVDTGAAYTNNAGSLVSLAIDADDGTTGSGIKEMMLSNDGTFDSEVWETWSPVRTDWALSAGDGTKTVYVKVRDFVENDSINSAAATTDDIMLDLTDPDITFQQSDYLLVNTATAQPGVIADPGAPASGSDIATIQWVQDSGPGSITFDNSTIASPSVSADADGAYELRVTVTDNAGNQSFGTVPFTWDTTAPDSTPAVSVAQYYSTESQPTWSWDHVGNTDFYKVSYLPSPDWTNPADYTVVEPNLADPNVTYTPDSARPEGANTLKVTASDYAGNDTAAGSEVIFVDTVAPVVTNDGQTFPPTNAAFVIDYTNPAVGEISDPGAPASGSGVNTRFWQKTGGSGTVTFSDTAVANPNVSADTDDTYNVSLTVTDSAGNQTAATFAFEWDQTAPTAPTVLGIVKTPNLRPTWTWQSAGDGSGKFRYGFTDGSGWIATEVTDISYRPASNLIADVDPAEDFTLYVQERDDAGNWSLSGSFTTNVDPTYKSAPILTLEGSTPRNATTAIWNWSSGTGTDSGVAVYRYSFDDGATWLPSAAGSTAETYTYSGMAEGSYTIKLEENLNAVWQGTDVSSIYFASNTVIIDLTGPTAPNVSVTTPTNDTTPYWSWSSGGSGDATGVYQYRIDGGAWSVETTATYLYTPTALAEGPHTLDVQEKDTAGNWSNTGSNTVTVDVTPPTLNSVIVNSGASYTNNSTFAVFVDAVSEGGLQMSLYRLYIDGTSSWSPWVAFSANPTPNITTGDGPKTIYVKLKDEAGNVCAYKYDSITLDTVAPVISSFSINNNALVTGTTGITLNSSVSDATSYVQYMKMANGSDGFSGNYTYSSSRSWSLSWGYGTKKVRVIYTDAAGNSTAETYDSIFYGAPSILTATKGATSNGSITVQFNTYGNELAAGTNEYVLEYATTEAGAKTEKIRISDPSTSTTQTFATGALQYLFVRMYNSDVGGYSSYSAYQIGYSSNVTVIYNDLNGTDANTANLVKSTLTTNWVNAYPSYISGSMPSYTVTLVPEKYISSSWNVDQRNTLYGDPVIVTPGVTFYTNSSKVRNVVDRTGVSGKNGIVAMGYGGSEFLERCSIYWSSWGFADQSPAEISPPYGMTVATVTYYMYQWTSGNSVWSSPLRSTIFIGGTNPTHNARVQISYTGLGNRYLIYRSGGSNPTGGWIYGRDDYGGIFGQYFSVLRQGRFLYYAYNDLADRPYTGKPYFANLVARMDNY